MGSAVTPMANLLHPPHPDFLPPGLSAWCYNPGDEIVDGLQVHTDRLRRAQRLVGLGNISILGSNLSETIESELGTYGADTEVSTAPRPEQAEPSTRAKAEVFESKKRGWLGIGYRPDAILTLDHERIAARAIEKSDGSPTPQHWASAIDTELHKALRAEANRFFADNWGDIFCDAFYAGFIEDGTFGHYPALRQMAVGYYASILLFTSSINKKTAGTYGLRDRRWSLFPTNAQPDTWLAAQALLALPNYNFVNAAKAASK